MMEQPTQEQIMKGCPFALQAGSYYNLLPWRECELMNNPIYQRGDGTLVPNYAMCAIDAGEECPHAADK